MDPSTSEPPSLTTLERRRHDQSYKRLFNTVAAVVALIRDLAAKCWADQLDLLAVDPFPTETVGPDLRRRLCDCAWRVRFKDGRSAVFLFEFQSSVDPGMVLRTLRYSEAAHTVLHTHERQRDPDGAMPLVPLVRRLHRHAAVDGRDDAGRAGQQGGAVAGRGAGGRWLGDHSRLRAA